MNMIPVESSNIESAGFEVTGQKQEEGENGELLAELEHTYIVGDFRVQFKRGGAYTYHEVPEVTMNEFFSSPSKGQYLAQYIKEVFNFTKG